MKKRLFSLVLASAMVLGALTACGGSKKETKAETTATETTAAADESSESAGDKILRVASEDPQVPLDMQLNTYSLIMKITDNTTESLLLTNPQGELEPTLLAEMPTLSDDKLTYSFTLKEGVTFHNGAPLTSNDVKYSLERMVKKLKMASLLEKVEGYQDSDLFQIVSGTVIWLKLTHHYYLHFPHHTVQFIQQRLVKQQAITGV